MRIVSLVPSWTETLIACGANVGGRTRFCIHPQEVVCNITVVGGTKDLDIEKLVQLKPDLLILDKEENLPWMLEQSPCPVFVSHVTDIGVMPEELKKLSDLLPHIAGDLLQLSRRWTDLLKCKHSALVEVPGVLHWISNPQVLDEDTQFVYVIWRKPWMCVSQNTFIGSMIHFLGGKLYLVSEDQKYPQFSLESLLNESHENIFFLFSSEPYPFFNKKNELKEFVESGMKAAIVDGECYSWFGVRSLRFLETLN